MSGGREALASLIRKADNEIKQCSIRAAVYESRPHYANFAAANWHYGFAAGVVWLQMQIELELQKGGNDEMPTV